CYNKLMAELTDTEAPDKIPKHVFFIDHRGVTRTFEVEFYIFPIGKKLEATEVGETKIKEAVHGELDDDFGKMWTTLISRIQKALNKKYMGSDGYVKGNKIIGYIECNLERGAHDVIIDGKPYTWKQLEKNISMHEGFKIKIEFANITDELK
ncbi:MAG: hypothetical protein FWF86_09375, partial [Clostridia bacterium]|nr:hypothetical protein [Clostridia bacterium]